MKISHSYESKLKPDKISAIIAAVLAFQNSNTSDKLIENNKLNKWKISFIENSIFNNKWTKFKW